MTMISGLKNKKCGVSMVEEGLYGPHANCEIVNFASCSAMQNSLGAQVVQVSYGCSIILTFHCLTVEQGNRKLTLAMYDAHKVLLMRRRTKR